MTIPQHVTKAHATGNDFVVYADPTGEFEPTADEVRFLCDRHRGIGGDGLIRLAHPRAVSDLDEAQRAACETGGAVWFMDYRNADGSLAEMCGNGTRAITLFAMDRGLADSGEPFRLGTRAGVKTLDSLGDVEPYGRDVLHVDMGAWRIGELGAYEVAVAGASGSARGTFVDMGNPHVVAVTGVDVGSCAIGALADLPRADLLDSTLPDVDDLDLTVKPRVSPVLESDQNVEFVRIDAVNADAHEGKATMRVHERGCGETLSCGTGLCATAITLRALTGVDHWDITVRGGILRVDVTDANVALTGSATLVGDIALR
ncbi:diaminopimelate epimerase [Bifidobacterium eulemuris]|nr:diaminopimelate epimerase [Bifidobacterium eulemuris]QOL33262.1 diaminopimelate epimerase [Bifidobacterium eulemuris]